MKKMLVAVCLALPATAVADDVRSLFGGYALDRRLGDSHHGVRTGADFAISRSAELEIAASLQRSSWYGSHDSTFGLMTGPRLTSRGERLSPFVQATGGVLVTWSHFDGGDLILDDRQVEAAGALDAGLDVALRDRWALRLQAGVLATREYGNHGADDEKSWTAHARGSVAIVWRPAR